MTANATPGLVPELSADAASSPELRHGPRTAMFVAATAVSGNRVQPVRIRNMSCDGAMLEGAVVPASGEEFELVRANLRVSARSTWVSGNQCGVSFKAPIDVVEWMARIAPDHQQQVDALVHQARRDIVARRQHISASASKSVSSLSYIQTAFTLLEELEGALADDELVVTRHQHQLQALDRAVQLLRSAKAGLTG